MNIASMKKFVGCVALLFCFVCAQVNAKEEKVNNSVGKIADKAFEAFKHGWETSDFSDFKSMLGPNVEFSYPTAGTRGYFSGAEGKNKMLAKIQGDAQVGRLKMTTTNRTEK